MMNGRPTKSRNSSKRRLRVLWRVLSSKAFLLLASLLVSVLFWSILVASDGTLTRQKTFASIPVSVTGEAALQSRGYIVMDDIQGLVPSVRLTVEITQANYDRVNGTSYNPHFDLSQITGEGENELTIGYSSQVYGPVISCEPSSVTVNVERYMTRRVPVVLETVGEAPQGVYLSATRTDPSMLSVSGPQSLVTTITRAVARLDASLLSAERMSDRTTLVVELQDASGAAVTSDKLQITNQTVITDSIVAETDLVPARDVPIDVDSLVDGEPAEGYALEAVLIDQNSLSVAAAKEVLDAITVLTADQPLDISGASEDVTGYVRLRRPSGLQSTLPSEIVVTAVVREQTLERTFRSVPVDVYGADEDAYRASLSKQSLIVELTGGYHFVNALSSDDIRLYVDASGLGEGKHELPVQLHIDNAGDISYALSSEQVTLTLRER